MTDFLRVSIVLSDVKWPCLMYTPMSTYHWRS